MTAPEKISRCGFVVAKILVDAQPYFLMRYSRKWHDVSFIGGHEMDRDSSKLSRAAYRELMEEVPPFRPLGDIELLPLTEQFCYGPVRSASAKVVVGYELQFFHLMFLSSPEKAIRELGPRSPNILLPQYALLEAHTYKFASLIGLLNEVYPGGLDAIPLSWPENLSFYALHQKGPLSNQLQLQLHRG